MREDRPQKNECCCLSRMVRESTKWREELGYAESVRLGWHTYRLSLRAQALQEPPFVAGVSRPA
jgi:hypothetical protein